MFILVWKDHTCQINDSVKTEKLSVCPRLTQQNLMDRIYLKNLVKQRMSFRIPYHVR